MPPPRPGEALLPGEEARGAAWLRALALVPAAFFIACALAPPVNHDVAALLDFTQRWWAGEPLYTRLLDVNPPLIFLLNLPPAIAAAQWPVPALQALQAWLLGLVALAAWLGLRVWRDYPAGAPAATAMPLALPLLMLAAGYEFGQREHLMAVAAMPYLLLAGRRAEGAVLPLWLRLAVALLAALGFALKPHFLAVPALVEAMVLWRRGWPALRDPVPWAMAVVWLCYVALTLLAFPAYAGRVLPLALGAYADLEGLTWWQVLLTERLGSALLVLPPLAVAALRPGAPVLARVVLAAALGAALSAVLQHKGWPYHALPLRLFLGLLLVVLALHWAARLLPAPAARRQAPGLAAALCWLLLGFTITGAEAPWREAVFGWSREGQLAALLRQQAPGGGPGGRVLVLSPDIYPVFPALAHAGFRSTLPTMNTWLLQAAYARCPADGARYHDEAAMPAAEAWFYRGVAEDFAAAPPDAVLVLADPRLPRCAGEEFDFLAYFSRQPLFAATFRRYHPVAELHGYRLFRREDP